MIWDRSKTIALAQQKCSGCFGLGLKGGRAGKSAVCGCVLRGIFRECYVRFRQSNRRAKFVSRVSLEACWARPNALAKRGAWSMKNEEFSADFLLIARRTLLEAEHRIFKWHFLYGADFKLVNRKLGREANDRAMFHEFYRIEQKLGRAFAECQPYSLWPVDEYFTSVKKETKPCHPIFQMETAESSQPRAAKSRNARKFPLKQAAA